MNFLGKTDWGRLFVPEMTVAEIVVRGTIIYLALCLLLRVVLKRQAGRVSLSDLLVVSIIAGVCRNPLVRDAYSVTDGVLVVAVVLFWSYALDWLCFHVPAINQLMHAPPLPLIRDGKVLPDSLRKELMTECELTSKLRSEGIREPTEVAEAWMEGDGQVSVIKQTKQSGTIDHDDEVEGAQNSIGAEIEAFLEAARRIEVTIARQEQAIAEHQHEIGQVKEALGRIAHAAGRRRASRNGRKHREKLHRDAAQEAVQ